MKNISRKLFALLSATLLTLQFAGASVTTVNTYSLTGNVVKTIDQGSDAVQGKTTTYDAYGRVATVTSIQNAVTTVSNYSYNAIGELSQVVAKGSDGATYVTSITNHGAHSETTISSPASGGKPVTYSVTDTFANGDSRTFQYGSDSTNTLNRVVSVSISTKWGNTVTYNEGESINGKTWADYCHGAGQTDPLVAGTVASLTNINGVNYAVIKADTVDMYDGKGAQAADGETIYVAVDDATYSNLSSQMQTGKDVSICVAGNVTANVDGHFAMTINEGGYQSAVGSTSSQVAAAWKAANQTFYNSMLTKMAPVWAAAATTGQNNNWKLGWDYLNALI